MDRFVADVKSFLTLFPFTGASWFVIFGLIVLTLIFYVEHRDPKSTVRFEHLICDSTNNRASPYKLGYLIGVAVSTWMIITMSDKGTLTFDMLSVYLMYLLGGAGWNSFVKNKNGSDSADVEPK
jgi:hypothetical protein